jgi:hypothetical protein
MAKSHGTTKRRVGHRTIVTADGERRVYPIKTVYYRKNRIVKINHALREDSACERAFGHLQVDSYGATHAEVYDQVAGKLHALLKRYVGTNEVRALFKREKIKTEKDIEDGEQ